MVSDLEKNNHQWGERGPRVYRRPRVQLRAIDLRPCLPFLFGTRSHPSAAALSKKEKNVGKEKSGKIFYKKLDQNIYQNLAQKMQPNLSTKLFNIKNLKKFVEIIF
jgi:hypothetical protein